MKILAFADLHLGAIDAYVDDPRAEEDLILTQIVELARDRQVDLITISGDVFHRPRPTPEVLHVFHRFVGALERAGIPAVAILGNAGHDQEGSGRITALELFDRRIFRVSRHPEVITEFAGVNVCTLPSTPVSRIVAASETTDRTRIYEAAAEMLISVAAGLRSSEIIRPDCPTILLLHWSIAGAALPSGLPVDDLREPILPIYELKALGYDMVIAGHIHAPQLLRVEPWIGYCGSPMIQSFGEAGTDHGVWLIDPDSLDPPEYVSLDGRRFVTIDCDLTDPEMGSDPFIDNDETDAIAAAIAEQLPLTDTVVRLRYRATDAQHRRIDLAALKGFVLEAGAHRLYQVAPEIVRDVRARAEGVDETLAPMTALDAYVESQAMAQPQADGLRLLLGRFLEVVS